MVVEKPEVAVQTHIDAGRLDHLRLVGVEANPARVEFRLDVAIREQHANETTGDLVPLWASDRGLSSSTFTLDPRKADARRVPGDVTGTYSVKAAGLVGLMRASDAEDY